MKWGLLWFDDDQKKDVKEKIADARERYLQKFKHQPNTCYVHPSMLTAESPLDTEVSVMPKPSVLKHHYWIGVEDEL